MSTPNPQIQEMLDLARAQLAAIKAEKLRLYPPNTDPLGSPDKYPGSYTHAQIEHRNQLNAQIEMLEQRIDDLQMRLYSK
jgi:hypothetical protein